MHRKEPTLLHHQRKYFFHLREMSCAGTVLEYKWTEAIPLYPKTRKRTSCAHMVYMYCSPGIFQSVFSKLKIKRISSIKEKTSSAMLHFVFLCSGQKSWFLFPELHLWARFRSRVNSSWAIMSCGTARSLVTDGQSSLGGLESCACTSPAL